MLSQKRNLIARELAAGTGATIAVRVQNIGMRKGLNIWFNDLEEKQGPIAELRPHGLKSYEVRIVFGLFSAQVLAQIAKAENEGIQLARALVKSVMKTADLIVVGQTIENWLVKDASFKIKALYRHQEKLPNSDDAIIETCHQVIVPLMAAMAELIGYDVVASSDESATSELEGALSVATIQRRERNPRNRLLCIRIHGAVCSVCNLDPNEAYGDAGNIIEVHHLEPVSLLEQPRPYDPEKDIVPLCPNCHRAIHTRRPQPLSLTELTRRMRRKHD